MLKDKNNINKEEIENGKPYAIWYIEYNANGGTGAPPRQEAKVGQPIVISTQKPTRQGYTFLGWNEWQQATSPDSSLAPGTTCPGWGYSIIAYAVWQAGEIEPPEESYTLSFDLQGGSATGGIPDVIGSYGFTFSITMKKPYKSGYTFQGWATSPSGQAVYQPGDQYTLTQNATLYAVWQSQGGGGTGGSLDLNWELYGILNNGTFGTNSAYSHSRKLTASELNGATVTTDFNLGVFLYRASDDKFITRMSDILVGTSTLSDQYLNENSIIRLSVSTSKKDTVIIKPKNSQETTWTITYNENGGLNAPSSQTASSDSDITITSSTPTWDGHVFQGWSKSQSGSVEYRAGDICKEHSSITLYAVWKQSYMNMYIGNNRVSSIYIGRDAVSEIYIGTNRIW